MHFRFGGHSTLIIFSNRIRRNRFSIVADSMTLQIGCIGQDILRMK